ncbi:MAG: response regulator [Candidatus Heimdallarchaeota archaeon]|nr:MAG: response regulator [Candidatus Heimdallarchaeota archaeon]
MDPPKNHSVLVVDEDTEYTPLIEQILTDMFSSTIDMFWFKNEEEVFDFLNAKTPSIISIVLLDIENSNFDGIAVLRQFKEESSPFKDVPIIIFSRLYEITTIRQCFNLGANSWVLKPRDLKKFRKKLETICEFWFKHAILPSSLI